METEDSFSNYRETFYNRWQRSVLKINWIVAFIVFGVEIFTYFALLNSSEREGVNLAYIIKRIVTPSFLDFTTLIIVTIAYKSKTVRLEVKNFLVSFGMFMLCSVVSIFHNYFQILLLSGCIAIFTCTIFGEIKTLNILEVLTIPAYSIASIVFWLDPLTGIPIYKALTILCGVAFIVCSYLFSKAIVKSQKDQLKYIQNSYRRQSELIDELRIDSLTKLCNRKAFAETVERIINLSKNTEISPYLVIMDIDFFKKVNDKYGHLAGDEVLVSLANIIRNNVSIRKAFRFGGEEFILLFEDWKEEDVIHIVKKIRKEFNEAEYDFATDASFTISAGISGLSKNFGSKEWIENADKALYFSKENGRDQYKIAELI